MAKWKKSPSLRKRLLLSILATLALALFLTTLFSFLYFFRFIRTEAIGNLERNLHVAEVIYQDRLDQVSTLSRTLADDKTVQILTDLEINNKLSHLVSQWVIDNPSFQITILDESARILTSIALSDSLITESGEKVPIPNNDYVEMALNNITVSGSERIIAAGGASPLSLTSATPIRRNNRQVGVVLVRNILNNDPSLVNHISRLLNIQAVIYTDSKIATASHLVDINPDTYYHLVNSEEEYMNPNLWTEGRLSHFSRITNHDQEPIAVLGVHDPSDKYINTLVQASAVFVMILFIFTILGAGVVIIVARSILNPIQDLLNGVNRITNGDLSYEIMTHLRDEIGKLSEAFNNMRKALQDKITTIETMNDSLEDTVKERTKTIENLLETMRRYLPSQLYEAIAGGERTTDIRFHYRKKLTIFFSDIVNFTSTTESMEAEDLSDLLNSYLDAMAKIANKWGGTLDKYVGDAVMIFFGDPEFTSDKDHALRAVRMALEMLDRMKSLRAEWAQKGIEKPLHIRIGINTGYCTIGNFGSEDRMDYTIIGGNVNLAARFESATQPDTILISHETYSLIENEVQCVFAGEMTLKGISHPVRTYQVIGEKKNRRRFHYMKVDEHGIRLKNSLIEPEKMTPGERKEFITALSKAIEYTRGKIKYTYDNEKKEWKLIEAKREPRQVNHPQGEGSARKKKKAPSPQDTSLQASQETEAKTPSRTPPKAPPKASPEKEPPKSDS